MSIPLLATIKAHVGEIGAKAVTGTWLKVPLAIAAGVVEYLIGADNKASMAALLVLIGFDLATAIMAKFKIGEEIESRKILKTATKTVAYALMASGAHLAEKIVPGPTFLDSAVISFLALTELISIIENVGKMGYAIPQKLLNKIVEIRDK